MVTGLDICKNARTVIGYPYVYGGNSKSFGGFDCSGLAQYAYTLSGINIPRTTYDQIKIGKKITNKNDLREGDLIFNFDKFGIPQHVLIYSGNGNVIEAQYEGTFIKEHSYWTWQGTAVRVLDITQTTPSPTPSVNPKPPVNTQINFRVIAGSYTSKANAITQQEKLLKAGFNSFIAIYSTPNILYRTVVGSYTNKENALATQNKLKSKGFDSFLIAFTT